MAEGKERSDWCKCAQLTATIINAHKVKGKPVKPNEVNPYYLMQHESTRNRKVESARGFELLKDLVDKKQVVIHKEKVKATLEG